MRNLIALIMIVVTANTNAGSGWSQRGKIVEIYNHGYTVMIKMSGTNQDYTEVCSSTSYYALNSSESASFNILFSQLMMAHASDADVQLWIDGNNCAGQGNNYQTLTTIKTFK